MSKVVGIANGDTALALGLAGAVVHEVANGAEAEPVFADQLKEDAAILVVQDAFRSGFSERFRIQLARHRGLPLIVYCPEFDQEESDVDAYLSSVLKPAVGYEIRLD